MGVPLCICLLAVHWIWAVADLTLKAPITTAAEDIHKYFLLFVRENKT